MTMAERMTNKLGELRAERQRRLEEAIKAGRLKAGFNGQGRLVVTSLEDPGVTELPLPSSVKRRVKLR